MKTASREELTAILRSLRVLCIDPPQNDSKMITMTWCDTKGTSWTAWRGAGKSLSSVG